MSAGIIIISTRNDLLTEFRNKLTSDGFTVEGELNLAILTPRDNLFIDLIPEHELTEGNGFEEEDLLRYRSLLKDFTKPLFGYYIKYHGKETVQKVLLSIADRSDIVIDDDNDLIQTGADFLASYR